VNLEMKDVFSGVEYIFKVSDFKSTKTLSYHAAKELYININLFKKLFMKKKNESKIVIPKVGIPMDLNKMNKR
ncbi:unnamed protein product, partial [marine sediment metagenome]